MVLTCATLKEQGQFRAMAHCAQTQQRSAFKVPDRWRCLTEDCGFAG